MQHERKQSIHDVWTPTKYGTSVELSGETLQLCTSARSGDGKFRFIWTLAPGKRGPSEHYHADEDEIGVLVSGRLQVWLDDVLHEPKPGDVIEMRRGTRHRFFNPGPEPAVVRVEYNGTTMEDVFVPFAVAAHPGKPRFKHMAAMLVGLLEKQPTVPTSKWEVRIVGTIARTLRLFGARAPAPVIGWDRDAR